MIGCAFTVLDTLGTGFLEKVYESVLAIEVRAAGLPVTQQCSVRVLCSACIFLHLRLNLSYPAASQGSQRGPQQYVIAASCGHGLNIVNRAESLCTGIADNRTAPPVFGLTRETRGTERNIMGKSGSQKGQSPSQLIDERIGDLGDWRGKMLSQLRALIKQADPR